MKKQLEDHFAINWVNYQQVLKITIILETKDGQHSPVCDIEGYDNHKVSYLILETVDLTLKYKRLK